MKQDNNIPQGYKQTELGIIPEEWEVAVIKDKGYLIKDSINPQAYPDVCFWEYSMPAYDSGMQPASSFGKTMHSNRTILRNSALLFNKLNVRQKRVWLVESPKQDSVCSMEFLPYVSSDISLAYLKHILSSDNVTEYFNGISKGTSNSQKRITPQDFLNYTLFVPPIAEQRAIAEALSDVDGLIAALDKKIAKKRLIKQGAMQQLLTGKTRLPGFTDKWIKCELLTVCNVLDNRRVPLNDEQRTSGIYPYCGANGIVDYIDRYIFDEDLILIAEDGGNFDQYETRPIAYWMSGKYWVNNHAHVLKAKNEYNQRYIFYQLEHKDITDYIVGGTRTKLTRAQLDKIEISIPFTYAEQQAIATILSDMDKEIADLEAQRDKYRLLKSGMMQKLLTGQIRLKNE